MSVFVASEIDDIEEIRRSTHPQPIRNQTVVLVAHLGHGLIPVGQECGRLALGDLFPLAVHRTDVGFPRADSIDRHGFAEHVDFRRSTGVGHVLSYSGGVPPCEYAGLAGVVVFEALQT